MRLPHASRRVVAGVVAGVALLALAGRVERGALGPRRQAPGGTSAPAGPAASRAGSAPALPELPLAAAIPLAAEPLAVEAGEGSVWLLEDGGALLRIDPSHDRITGRLQLGPLAGDAPTEPLAVGAGAVWVGTAGGTVRVDPVTMRPTGRLGARVEQVADGALYGRSADLTSLVRTDPRTLRPQPVVVRVRAADGDPGSPILQFAVAGGSVWTVGVDGTSLVRSDERGRGAVRVAVPGVPRRLAAAGGALWVLCVSVQTPTPGGGVTVGPALLRLDPGRDRPAQVTPLLGLGGNNLVGPVAGGGWLWLVDRDPIAGSALLRVDPADGRVAGRWQSPRLLGFLLAAGPGGVWLDHPDAQAGELLHVDPGRLRP